MRMKRIAKGTEMGLRGAVALGVLGVVFFSLVMSGCSSGSGGDSGILGDSPVGSSGSVKVEASATAGIEPKFDVCGGVIAGWPLTADETIDVGDVGALNDRDYIYVPYTTAGGWVILEANVHVGFAWNDYPGYGQGNNAPIPGDFAYNFEAEEGEAVEEHTFAIPFTDLGLEHGECDVLVLIFAHATVALLDGGGSIIQTETAWGGDHLYNPGTPEWYGNYAYRLKCCEEEDGGFRTQTQGGWGTICHGQNPGCYRDEWFDIAFPDGLTIGCEAGYTMIFTSSEAVQEFLPNGGKPGVLESDYVNPTGKTEAGVLAGQLLAASLTLGFDATDPDFAESPDLLADQVLCGTGTAFDGWTVGDLVYEANVVLGDCESDYEPGEISEALTIVNENYVDGEVDNGYICAP